MKNIFALVYIGFFLVKAMVSIKNIKFSENVTDYDFDFFHSLYNDFKDVLEVTVNSAGHQ